MRLKQSTKYHLETARLLCEGIRESMEHMDKSGNMEYMAPQDSITSIKRRCIQARQELLQVELGIDKREES
jgi:hypothetical protein